MKRKYVSGWDKKKKNQQRDKLTQSLAGSLDKFIQIGSSSNISTNDTCSNANVDNDRNDDSNEHTTNEETLNLDETMNENLNVNDVLNEDANGDASVNVGEDDSVNASANVGEEVSDLYDPGNWKKNMSQSVLDLLIEKGPIRVVAFDYPKNGQNRSFKDTNYTRHMKNGEKHDRQWLVYSCKVDKVFCFCCSLFSKGASSPLTTVEVGYNNWKNIHSRLSEHEASGGHIDKLQDWWNAEKRLKRGLTIDASTQKAINKEKAHWRKVIKRILHVVVTLSTTNLAFRGSNEKIDDESNGIFLSMIKMISQFDPTMKEHLRRIRQKEVIRNHYLGHNIQNEIILLLANEVRSTILKVVKEAKYFSVILDCTPDVSHEEQMSLVLRCVNISKRPIRVEEFFIDFLKVVGTSGESLFNELKRVIGTLLLDFDDVRGQGYDNGSNMKGQYKGVQSRLIQEYPRAFYTPCGCHSLNLALCDMCMSCVQAKTFFGVVQRIYNLFSGSSKRWEVLKKYVKKDNNGKGLTLKSWSDTRWESRVSSVRAIRFQTSQIRDALFDLVENSGDASTTSDAESLATFELSNFDFLIGMVIWFEILTKVNKVSKILQQKDMNIDVAITLLKGLIVFFEEYRNIGFELAKTEAIKIASELEVEPKFRETRVRRKKSFFDENARDEPIQSAEECFRVTYFLCLVDNAISSLATRFEQFTKYEAIFGVLLDPVKLKSASEESLRSSCDKLEVYLKHGDKRDVDARELFSELQLLRNSLPQGITKAMQVLEHIKDLHIAFPNAWITYRIILTIPVTVATAERSFSKLKLIKNYLRSTMLQDRLSGLALLSIEKNIVENLDCNELIREFALKKARRINFLP